MTVKIVLIGAALYSTIAGVWGGYTSYGDKAVQKTPLFGIYNITRFVKNKDTLAPLATDSLQWKQLSIVFANNATIKMMNDSLKRYSFKTDTVKKTVNLFIYSDTLHKSTLRYYQPDPAHLVLTGKLKEDSVHIVMEKLDLNKLRLVNRGFHWINEFPYNR